MSTKQPIRLVRPKSIGVLWIGLLCTALLSVAAAPASLRIELLRGAGANNNAETGRTVSPLVRIVDDAGKPVPKALVVFAAPSSGPSVEFAGHGRSAQVLSDDSGEAAAPHVRPIVADGEVEIRITAAKDGGSASASVAQMNLGVELRTDSDDGVEFVMLAGAGDRTPARPGEFRSPHLVRFRVEDQSGKPVPGVEVQVIVQALKSPNKSRELDSFKQVSNQDGQIVAVIPLHSGNDPLEIVLKTGRNGRATTRYFKLES
jgi:hypothetical protein